MAILRFFFKILCRDKTSTCTCRHTQGNCIIIAIVKMMNVIKLKTSRVKTSPMRPAPTPMKEEERAKSPKSWHFLTDGEPKAQTDNFK